MRALVSLFLLFLLSGGNAISATGEAGVCAEDLAPPKLGLNQLAQDTFRYFWETTDSRTGLAPDRYPSDSPASIAAVGFALTSYPIGVDRGFITREQASERTLNTLRFLWSLPMGPEEKGVSGYQGFYYHFLKMTDGTRAMKWEVELSTVDTALLMAGVLFSQSYFDRENSAEAEIRDLADKLYRRVNWPWAQNYGPLISLGWLPKEGFLPYDWAGYSEAMLIYILALGSPTHPIEKDAWDKWAEHYSDDWGWDNGFEYLTFAPMFGHQYSHVWIDFRDIQDEFMKEKGSSYFLNSKAAAYAQRQYSITNPGEWNGYGENFWGLTASDGPGRFNVTIKGKHRKFSAYRARGVGPHSAYDDGTLAPTAILGSLPFAPEIILPALDATYEKFGKYVYTKYGFVDAYNPTFQYNLPTKTGKVIPGVGWIASDYIGIDQGPILAMTENFQSEFVWRVMRKNPYIKRGLKRAGFTGGWLEE